MLFILAEEIKMWPVLMMIQCEARGEVTEPENFPSHFSEQLS